MKTLIIVRHAKSDHPEYGEIPDRNRTLNPRGIKDAPFMGELLASRNIKPDKIYSSPAARALQTAKYFAEKLEYPVENIQIEEYIYSGGPEKMIKLIKGTNNDLNLVAVFGHNPDVTILTNVISGYTVQTFSTCGVVVIDFSTDKWENISNKNAKLRFYEYPKKNKIHD
ncbi:MAG: putative phosphohistidine phosphatase, SixA [Ignavibacteria bacterium]|nr:putative phosphohistidine phosphatase, SixA [Ignavibacteria bacterium]